MGVIEISPSADYNFTSSVNTIPSIFIQLISNESKHFCNIQTSEVEVIIIKLEELTTLIRNNVRYDPWLPFTSELSFPPFSFLYKLFYLLMFTTILSAFTS